MNPKHALNNLLALATIIGGPEQAQKISDQINAPVFEEDPKWNGLQKIPHTTCFLSVGPGALEDKVYPCLMAPVDSPWVKEGTNYLDKTDEFVTLARLKMGYDTAGEALSSAGQMMTSVPIFKDGTFTYPYYKHDEYMSKPAVIKAADRRLTRQDKAQREQDLRNSSYDNSACELCGGLTGHYSWCAK